MDVHHNPIIQGKGVCDPHVHIFRDKAYLYASHDVSPQNETFATTDWLIYSSADLVNWELESVFRPEDTYIGGSSECWAVDAQERDGRYYYYFSHGTHSIGVAVSGDPGKGFADRLGRPLLDAGSSPTRAYDPAVFTDDDNTSYIVFGTPVWAGGDSYYIARLNADMVSLAEAPKKIILDNEADDKPFLHKYNGRYYLSWASHYAIADTVYGPYHYVGNTGAGNDHGNFFEWNNQWFQSFTIYDPTQFHRATGLCYVHYRQSGEMVVDQMIVEHGVGAYDARWNKIFAVWYMGAENVCKREYMSTEFVLEPSPGGYAHFPNVRHIQPGAAMYFFACSVNPGGAEIEVRENSVDGELLGSCKIGYSRFGDWRGYGVHKCALKHTRETMDLYLVFKGEGERLLNLEWFKFA